MFKNLFKNCAVKEILVLWENTVRPGCAQMAIWCTRIACWIAKATDTHSEYVILLSHGNNCCTQASECYVYTYIGFLLYFKKKPTRYDEKFMLVFM